MTQALRDPGAPAATILVVDDEPGNRRLLRTHRHQARRPGVTP